MSPVIVPLAPLSECSTLICSVAVSRSSENPLQRVTRSCRRGGAASRGSEVASVREPPKLRQLDGWGFGRLMSLRFRSDGDQSHSLCTRSGEQLTHFGRIANQNRSLGQSNEPGIALLDGIAWMANVVDGNGEQRQTARSGVAGREGWHSWSASSEDLDIGNSVHEQRVESSTKPCVLDTLPTTNDENPECHAVSLGVAGVGGDVGWRGKSNCGSPAKVCNACDLANPRESRQSLHCSAVAAFRPRVRSPFRCHHNRYISRVQADPRWGDKTSVQGEIVPW